MSLDAVSTRFTILKPEAARGAALPWWFKMGAKIALARLPIAYEYWRRMGLFRHGSELRQLATARARLSAVLKTQRLYGDGEARVILELGPGDSLAIAVAAKAMGLSTRFVDVGDFAAYDAERYRALAKSCTEDPNCFATADFSTRDKMLASCDASYEVGGLNTLRAMPSASIDASFSYVVLEHVRKAEFGDFMAELYRVTRPGGTGRHSVDVMDHLGGGLNNLRFPSSVWESSLMATSGFYTNRLRPRQIVECAIDAGFDAQIVSAERFVRPPLPTSKMAKEFRRLDASDFEIATFDLALYKPAVRA